MIAAARLAQDQQTLLGAVLGGQADDALWALVDSTASGLSGKSLARRGLLAYQSHGLALAERALGAAYPVIAQLMGGENFAALAPHFWRAHPPTCGDMGQWGDGLANFLAAAPQLAGEPFLADVARVEWALHRASFAADSSADLASFGLLSAEPPATPSLRLSPGVWLLDSAFPVVSLIQAHGLPLDDRKPALAYAADLLARGKGEKALVWREGFKPSLRQPGTAEYALLLALQAGQSLEAALAQAGQVSDKTVGPAFDFARWLAHSVQSGLVTGACLISSITDNNKEASP
jgi:Putative DNA-binding domain